MKEKALKNLGIEKLNEMQLAAIDKLKNGGNLVLLSPTGSGKTLAFLFPLLNLLDPAKQGVQALILVPSRELALQIEQVFKTMSTGFKVNCCYGGHSMKIERNNFEHPPAVLIGTPGRLVAHMRNSAFDPGSVSVLVLDEFDKSLEFGFNDDMASIIGQLGGLKMRILTSATRALEVPAFAGMGMPMELNYLSEVPPKNLSLRALRAVGVDKLHALFGLVCKLGNRPALVFCNHRDAVERISELLLSKGLVHGVFHGGLEQEDRERALIKFRNGTFRMLITTDLASRGLDIPEVEYVIHYQLPPNENAYTHRNGRTARMHAEGTSFLVLAEDEYIPPYLDQEPEMVTLPSKNIIPQNSDWDTLYVAAGKKDKINKMDIVGLLHQKGKLERDQLGLIEVLDHTSYAAVKRDKIRETVELIKNEKIKNKKVKMGISVDLPPKPREKEGEEAEQEEKKSFWKNRR